MQISISSLNSGSELSTRSFSPLLCPMDTSKSASQERIKGNSLVVQWLALCAFTAEGPGSIPGQGTKILQAMMTPRKKKERIKIGIPAIPATATHTHTPCSSSCILPTMHPVIQVKDVGIILDSSFTHPTPSHRISHQSTSSQFHCHFPSSGYHPYA